MDDFLNVFAKIDECDQRLKEMTEESMKKLNAVLFGGVTEPTSHKMPWTAAKQPGKTANEKCLKEPNLKSEIDAKTCNLRVKIKTEKLSLAKDEEEPQAQEAPQEAIVETPPAALSLPLSIPSKADDVSDEATVLSETSSTSTAPPKKTRTKKNLTAPQPIKVERFSDIGIGESPVASRTRKGGKASDQQELPGSVFQDAVASNDEPILTSTPSPETRVSATPTHVDEKAVKVEPPSPSPTPAATAGGDESFGRPQGATKLKSEKCLEEPNPLKADDVSDEATMASTALSAPESTSMAPPKKTRKKKNLTVPQPIKVERFSDIGVGASPVASRTRKGGAASGQQQRHGSVFEDAVDSVPLSGVPEHDAVNMAALAETFNKVVSISAAGVAAADATMVLDGPSGGATIPVTRDATFVMRPPKLDETVTLDRDATFLVLQDGNDKRRQATKTQPPKSPVLAKSGIPKPMPLSLSAKACRMPKRNNESLSPSASGKPPQFPYSITNKENINPKGMPTYLKSLLTPSQFGIPHSVASAKKTPANLKSSTNAGSAKAPPGQNSADEYRKGHSLQLEERKRQREQKHLLAAQQREAKERERAERFAKLAKEREEKRIRKQQEAEQKKCALEEIQRKLRHQEETDGCVAASPYRKAAKMKAANDQERDMLKQMKQQPRAAIQKKRPARAATHPENPWEAIEMPVSGESSDEEDQDLLRWHAATRIQDFMPTEIINAFFSIRPLTFDLRDVFPDIEEDQLQRNSSASWLTPPTTPTF